MVNISKSCHLFYMIYEREFYDYYSGIFSDQFHVAKAIYSHVKNVGCVSTTRIGKIKPILPQLFSGREE